MFYRPYYGAGRIGYGARRLALGSLWRRPGTLFGRGTGYGYRRGLSPYRTGYRGFYGATYRGRRPGALSYYSRYRQHWPLGYRGRFAAYGRAPAYYGGAQVYGAGAPPQAGPPAPPSLAPQWVLWAQACLAQIVGSWVPQTGQIGKATRKAIGIFQSQQQLPATGLLDAATVNALQQACSGQAAAALPMAPPAGDDVAAATAASAPTGGADAAGAAPDGGAALDAAGAPDASAGAPPADGATAGEFEGWRGRRRRRLGRLWGGGSRYQSDDDDDSGDPGSGQWGGGWRRRWR